jgi:outer membrane protein assembly factor BamB
MQLVAVVVASLTLSGCWWWVPGHDANHSGHNSVEDQLSPATVDELSMAWTYGPWGMELGPPTVSQSGVHVAMGGCGVVTLDRATGTERWFANWAGGSPDACADPFSPIVYASPPFVDGDRLMAGAFWWMSSIPSPRYDIFTESYATADGAPLGRSAPRVIAGIRGDQGLFVTPIVYTLGGGIPIPTGYGPMVFATFGPLDDPSQQRTIRTAVTTGGQPLESGIPTLGTEHLFHAGTGVLSTTPGDPATGRSVRAYTLTGERPGCGPTDTPVECPVWSQPVDGTVTGSPVLNALQNRIYVGTSAGTVYNFDAQNGVLQWSASVAEPVVAEPALAGNVLYVATAGGHLYAFDALGCGAASCPPLWSADTGGGVEVQPAVAGGLVFTGSTSGAVRAFDAAGCGAATCPALWTASTGSAVTGAPAIARGAVYLATADGRVIAYTRSS